MEQEIKIGQIWHYNSAWVKGAWKEYEIIEINKVAKTYTAITRKLGGYPEKDTNSEKNRMILQRNDIITDRLVYDPAPITHQKLEFTSKNGKEMEGELKKCDL